MDANMFGITDADVEEFTLEPTADEIQLEDVDELIKKYEFATMDSDWIERAKIIAMLPGLDDPVKVACIFMGFPHIISQVFFLHAVMQGEATVHNAIMLFTVYCTAVGLKVYEISAWVAFYFGIGVFQQDNLMATLTEQDPSIGPGPLMPLIGMGSGVNLEITLKLMSRMQPFLEAQGIVFGSDKSLLQNLGEEVLDISHYAPDKPV